MNKGEKYETRAGEQLRLNGDQCAFLHRRTMPFLDGVGIQAHTLPHLLQEAYLQGIRDTLDVLNYEPENKPESLSPSHKNKAGD